MAKLRSLSIFFPFYNDAGTVSRQIDYAYSTGSKFTDDLEVIALHGGDSKDDTYAKILEEQKKYPSLVVVNKQNNFEGYAVIKYGFKACTKEWVFYTDGDAQYHIEEDLPKLVALQERTGADVINGYKKHRGDNFLRTLLGNCYKLTSRAVFRFPIRDVDCDFRLIRKSALDKILLESQDASILPELIKKLEMSGAKMAETQVSHYRRVYGTSNYTAFSLLKEKVIGDIKLFLRMRKVSKATRMYNVGRH